MIHVIAVITAKPGKRAHVHTLGSEKVDDIGREPP